ncbi:MAG: hypothetical protein GY716_16405 [bacterium]|nr:hypothetical protein [bacterium]
MTVQFIEPARKAWDRTRAYLFDPFDLERWLVTGFAAFLAGLGSGMGGGTSGINYGLHLDDIPYSAEEMADALLGAALLIPILLFVVGLALLLLWVSSQGRFLFLDNLVCGRPAILEPWRRLSPLGTSLFLWRIGFGLTCIALSAIVVTPLMIDVWAGGDEWRAASGFVVAVTVLAGIAVGLVCAFVALCVENFVVPTMYARGVGVLAAWGCFLPHLRARLFDFLIYAATVILAFIAVGAGVVLVALATCCFGALILAIPYVNSLVLLPLTATYRLYGVEFLAQFDAEVAGLLTAAEPAAELNPPDPTPPE